MEENSNLPRVESPHTTLPEDTLCKSCGRFVGAYERCPFCQADMGTRFSVVLAKRIAVFGSIIGLIILLIASRNKQVETIQIGKIAENNNMALVRIEGRVVNLRVREEQNGFSISLDDGTGRISLSAFDKLRLFRDRMGENFPRIGDLVSAVGNLQITEKWGATMFLSSPGRLKVLERQKIETRDFEAISRDDVNSVFDIQAQVADIRKFTIGRTITLRQDGMTLPLSLFDSDYEKIADAQLSEALLIPGSVVALRVSAGEYKGDLQLKIADVTDKSSNKVISRGKGSPVLGSTGSKGYSKGRKASTSSTPATAEQASAAPAQPEAEPARDVTSLSEDMSGSRVAVIGTVIESKDFKSGVKLELQAQGGAAVTVWVKASARDGLADKSILQKGSSLRAAGTVSAFKGALQINPETSADLTRRN